MPLANQPLAVFRFDADPTIGGGHALRCQALAGLLHRSGWQLGFATRSETLSFTRTLDTSLGEVLELSGDQSTEAEQMRARWPGGVTLAIVDHYHRDLHFEQALAGWADQRFVIDDLPGRQHDCEILLDQTPGRVAQDYTGSVPRNTRLLCGPAYALLRPEFLAARPRIESERSDASEARIVVGFGLSDLRGLCQPAIEGILASGFSGRVDVMIGSGAASLPALRDYLGTVDADIRLHIDCNDVATMSAGASLALGATGVTCLELCCLGVPGVYVIVADNQRDNAAGIKAAGAAMILGEWPEVSSTQFAAAVSKMVLDNTERSSMRERGLCLVDGRGIARIGIELAPERARDNASVVLRPAGPADIELVYEWQCHPDTRRFARNAAIPSWEEHQQWMQNRLRMPHTLFNIVECEGKAAGVVRLDELDAAENEPGVDISYEISILVAPDHYQRGIGKAALALARRLVTEADIHADVLPENVASHRLFQAAGYVPRGRGYIQKPARPSAHLE